MKPELVLKRMVFFIAGTLSVWGVHAQAPQPVEQEMRLFNVRYHTPELLSAKHVMPLKDRGVQQHKPTTLHSRIIAFAISEYDGSDFQPGDSIYMYWVNNREASFDGNTLLGYFFIYSNSLILNPLDDLLDIMPNCDSALTFSWSGAAYDVMGKSLIELDANGNVQSETDLEYNGSNLENSYKTIYTYDANNNLTSELDQNWDAGAWVNVGKDTFAYDANNNLTEYKYQSWNDLADDWDNEEKSIYSYDANNNWTSETNMYWNGASNNWLNTWKYTFQYTGNERTEQLEQSWNPGTNIWENLSKIGYSYGSGGERTEDLEQNWSAGTSSWENSSRTQYTYDAGEHNTSSVSQGWNGSAWENLYQSTYLYSGDMVASIVFANWDAMSDSFVNSDRILGTYNSYDQLTEFKMEVWSPGDFWESQNGSPKFNFYYEEYDDGVGIDFATDGSVSDFLMYPNPAGNQLTIDAGSGKISQVQVIDISGKVVFQSQQTMHASKITLPTQNLANGIYMLKINGNGQSGNKTFIVKH